MRYTRHIICLTTAMLFTAKGIPEENTGGIQVEADRTMVRVLPDSSVVKEYSGDVHIQGRSFETRAARAMLEPDSGVFRLYGGSEENWTLIRIFDDKRRERVRFSARESSLFVREGLADSAFAVGSVRIHWKTRNARVEADTVCWSASGRLIRAGGAVRLFLPGMTERGSALEARDDLRWYTMRGVSGTIRPRGGK